MDLPIENCDYFIYYLNLPPRIYAFVMDNGDGTYSIFLDPRRSRDQQIESYIHELWHIIHGDIYNGVPIYIVEKAS